jgi:hypothetical protein
MPREETFMKCLLFSGRVAAAVLVIALTLLVVSVPAHAEISSTSDALFIRSAMQPLIDFLDSPDYAKMVSWEEHVVLAYRLAADRDPSSLEFFLMRKAHAHLGLSRSDVLSIALRGEEERPSWEQCLRFLSRVSISDFQLDGGILEKVRELTAVPDREVLDTITRTTATVRTGARNEQQVPSQTGPPDEQYNIYFGYLHAHSTISDGEGSPLTAYKYARDEGGLDFFALTDHDYAFSVWPWEDPWGEVRDAAEDTYEPEKYVTLWGFEWSSPVYGHINVLNSSRFTDFVREPTLDAMYNWIEDHSGSFGRFNHPGDYDETGQEFNHLQLYSRAVEQMVGIETWNGNDGFDRHYYAGSWSSSEISYWDVGNQNGWYLGALGGQDNHKRDWGTRNDFRTAVLAKTLTRDAVIEAYLKRRFYATEDKDLHLDFRCAGYPMGSRLDGVAPLFEVMAWDGSGDTFREVRLYRNGALLKTYDVAGNSIDIQLDGRSSDNEPAYYYVIVQENDDNDANGRNDEAISSPIWIINPSPIGQILSDIKANATDGPVTLSPQDRLSITVTLDNKGNTDNADWWLAENTPFGVYFYTFAGWTQTVQPAYQGPLFPLNSFEVLNMPASELSPGTYTFFFGVDTVMDGTITMENANYDFVQVNVVK